MDRPFRPSTKPSIELATLCGLLLLAAACGDPEERTPLPSPDAPAIVSFVADPDELPAGGGSTTLRWVVTDATSLELRRGDEALDLGGAGVEEGSIEVEVGETTAFRLRAHGEGESAERDVVVTVLGSAPTIATFTAPAAVEANEEGRGLVPLSWTGVHGAAALLLQTGDLEPIPLDDSSWPDGSAEVEIEGDTTFTLIASNEWGEARLQASTHLAHLPRIDAFDADRSRIGVGETFTLSWETSNAFRVELWVGGSRHEEELESADTIELTAMVDIEVELRAYDALERVVSRTLEVAVGAPEIRLFTVENASIWLGEPFRFEWESEGGSELRLLEEGVEEPLCTTQDLEEIVSSGCEWAPEVRGARHLVLEVRNASGVASEPLEVYAAAGPAIEVFAGGPASLDVGDEVVLSWEVRPDPDGAIPTLQLTSDRGGSWSLTELEGTTSISIGEAGAWAFTLRATTEDPRSEADEAAVVIEALERPVVQLSATPNPFDDTVADHVRFDWTSAHAEALTLYRIEEGAEPAILHEIDPSEMSAGSLEYRPQIGATYRLVGVNGNGTEVDAEVFVDLAPPEIVRFDAAPLAIVPGQAVELSWETKMGSEVKLSIFDEIFVREEITRPFIDASMNGGTHLPLTGECSSSGNIRAAGCAVLGFPPDFSFPFDGEMRLAARVYGNGFLSFDTSVRAEVQTGNQPFPTDPAYAFVHMAPFWDSLGWDESRFAQGNVYHLTIEEEGKKGLVIQWANHGFLSYRDSNLNFEIVLWEDGSFEYRYGQMKAGGAPAAWERGESATIGFQQPSGRDADTRLDGKSAFGIQGPLYGRTFAYRYAPPVGPSGSYVWHPFSNSDRATVTLEVIQNDRTDSQTISINLLQRPTIEPEEIPGAPVLAGEPFRVGWRTNYATAVEVLDETGTSRCVAGPAEIEAGYCTLSEEKEGAHAYLIRATGANGFTLDREVEVWVYEDFGVIRFEVDRPVVEHGESVTVSWETRNAAELRLMANGQDLPITDHFDRGSYVFEDIQQTTSFLLLVSNSLGMTVASNALAEVWKIRMELTPSATSVRPGEEVVVQVNATSIGGGDLPVVYGTFPLQEVADAPFVDISTLEGSTNLEVVNSPVNVSLPEGFTFPYFGSQYSQVRVFPSGYISFDLAASHATSNQRLPNASSSNAAVHLAPFWDSLVHRNVGTVWTGQLSPDTFVIQWKNYSPTSGTTIFDYMDLNFQIVLHRDGTFEYRYGQMNPLIPPATNNGCHPNTCVNEANGSSATIGYQRPGTNPAPVGFTAHFGGTNNGANNAPYPGGLSNRTLRYKPLVGSASFTYAPITSQTLAFCSMSGGVPVCKYLDIDAEFRLDFFEASSSHVGFDQPVLLEWASVGGRSLRILQGEDELLHTTDVSRIDQGSLEVRPTRNTTYTLEMTATDNAVSAQTSVVVDRAIFEAQLSSSSSFPGDPVTLSWTATKFDPAMELIPIKPMEEISATFSELDISRQDGVTFLIGAEIDGQIVRLDFDDFVFPFAGENHAAVMVSSEGYLSFDLNQTSARPSNLRFPTNAANASVHIAPFWDDFHTRIAGQVMAKKIDADRYVIQWNTTSLRRGSSAESAFHLSFMVVLHRNGDFEFRYGEMLPPTNPAGSTSDCNPAGCHNEANGSAATIGYQEPSATLGYNLHFGGTNPSATQLPVAGGLSNRSWKFTNGWQSGSMQVRPADTTSYEICALDPASGDVFCADPVQVEVKWGITSFEATPWAPLAGQSTTLSWAVQGLDTLTLKTGAGLTIASYTRNEIPSPGSIVETPAGNTEYILEGTSLGRVVEERRMVEMRQFDLDVQIPAGPYFPGENVSVSWTSTTYGPGDLTVFGPMGEIEAGPGTPGAFVDISEDPQATPVTFQGTATAGYASIELPFAFPFFGGTHTKAQVYVDGYLSFDETLVAGQGTNQVLPNDGASYKRVHLAPFWDDLYRRGGHEMIYTRQIDPDTFVIQWKSFSRSSGSSTTNLYDLNFEIVLFRDGSFEYRYGKMAPPPPPFSSTACFPNTCLLEANGASATIGYQNVDGTFGHTLHYGGNSSSALVEFQGGLGGRSFRFEPGTSGSVRLPVGASGELPICAILNGFVDCKTVTIETVAKPGELMFTELMIDPKGGARQWFEVRNVTQRHIDLQGFVLEALQGSVRIDAPLVVAPGAYVTFAPDAGAGFTPDVAYGEALPLVTTADELTLRAGTMAIASVSWGASWYVPPGRTLSLDPSYHREGVVSNDDFERWCEADAAGTPGNRGKGCRYPFMDLDPNSRLPFIDISLTGTRFPAVEGTSKLARLPITGFSMPFFDTVAETFWIGSNGWISLFPYNPGGASSPSPTGSTWLPRSANFTPKGPLIAAYYDDLSCSGCAFYYEQRVEGGEEVLILQWTDYVVGLKPGSITFQVQLWEDGDVVIAFAEARSEDPSDAFFYEGSLAWVALEAPDRTDLTMLIRSRTALEGRTIHYARR